MRSDLSGWGWVLVVLLGYGAFLAFRQYQVVSARLRILRWARDSDELRAWLAGLPYRALMQDNAELGLLASRAAGVLVEDGFAEIGSKLRREWAGVIGIELERRRAGQVPKPRSDEETMATALGFASYADMWDTLGQGYCEQRLRAWRQGN